MAGVDMTSAIHGEYYMESWRVHVCFFRRSRPCDILFTFHLCARLLNNNKSTFDPELVGANTLYVAYVFPKTSRRLK